MNTITCLRCDAMYSRNTKWVKGFANFVGTESEPRHFSKTADVPANVCPICGTPEGERPGYAMSL